MRGTNERKKERKEEKTRIKRHRRGVESDREREHYQCLPSPSGRRIGRQKGRGVTRRDRERERFEP